MNIKAYFPIILLIGLFLISIFSVKIQSPPPIIGKTGPLEAFSAMRAIEHLKIIAQAPHSSGTAAHEEVRKYIVNYCEEMGLEVSIQDTMAARKWGSTLSASHVKNIIARFKGKRANAKHLLVLSHYDSQPNTPGAADDGAGVVAMLETIRALSLGAPLEHDVLFVFTDQEESGLLGAEAFVNTGSLATNTGVLLNFESRGNKGVAYTFEVNEENGWVIKHFAKGAPYPVANSMAYEIYKIMPNDSDFSMFRKGKYTGVNQANIDGFANYHSMTDIVENIDPRIVQHHGSNMLGLIRHFDQQDLDNTKADDVNFFNPVGRWLWYFPAFLNIPLILLCIGLVILLIYANRSVEGYTFSTVMKGLGIFLFTILVSIGIGFILLAGLLKLYPHYSHFYANNFYNVHFYFWMFMGVTLLVFGLIYGNLFRSQHPLALFTGVVIFKIILLVMVHFFFETATYVIYYPLIFLLVLLLLKVYSKNKISPLWYLFLGMIPLLLLWAPIIQTLYIVFSLVIPYASMLLFGILLAMALPFWQKGGQPLNGMKVIGASVLLLSIILGHINSKPTLSQPLQSYLSYVLDRDENKAYWLSVSKHQDEWTEKYVDQKKYPKMDPLYEDRFNWPNWRGEASVQSLESPKIIHGIIPEDSSRFKHAFTIVPQREIIGLEIFLNNVNTLDSLILDGRPILWNADSTRTSNRLLLHAIRKEGLNIRFTSPQADSFSMTIIERSLRIPSDWLKVPMPDNYIQGTGNYSDAIFTKETFTF